MTDLMCPACVIRIVDPGGPGEWRDPSCTGRPGCVQKGGVEPGVDAPATSGADIVERLRLKAAISRSETDGAESMESAAIDEAADEIARLRAEVERLTRQVDHWIGCARATESHAARLEDRRADLAARAADLALKAQAVAKADRAAITAALKETPDA